MAGPREVDRQDPAELAQMQKSSGWQVKFAVAKLTGLSSRPIPPKILGGRFLNKPGHCESALFRTFHALPGPHS